MTVSLNGILLFYNKNQVQNIAGSLRYKRLFSDRRKHRYLPFHKKPSRCDLHIWEISGYSIEGKLKIQI